MKGDFSRSTFRRDRAYSGVRMQQGRVPLDADWNEQVDVDAYLRRRAIADIIGGCCIPATAPDSYRVSAEGQRLHVAGGRAWVQGLLAERPDAQVIDAPVAGRHAVYLEVFERHVTAIEDPDIREVALGGPDTATRTATTVRAITVAIEAGQGCIDLQGRVPPGQTTGHLTASTGAQPPDTPCVVPAAAGYARLENQLYRVEVQRSGNVGGAAPATFKWSRDNGSIAAEWLATDGDEIVIPDAGRDTVLGFHDNRWIELSHDALDLAGEMGILVEVIGRRTDGDGRYRLRFDAHGQVVPDPAAVGHPKVRRWDHDAGSDPVSGAIAIAAANTPIAIEGGIEVRFSPGHYRAGDYWMIPARTFSAATIGDILWPRDVNGVPQPQAPHGVARAFCRLAIVQVDPNGGVVVVEDCRRTFPSLCGIERGRGAGCCTVTVGANGGDVATIGEGVARLPPEGGEVCILPGVYRERIVLTDRRDITFHGCGPRTRLVAPDAQPVFDFTSVERIRVEALAIDAREGHAVSVRGSSDVTLNELDVRSRDRAAISARDSDGFTMTDSHVIVVAEPRGEARARRDVAVFAAGDDLRIERNRIEALAFERRAQAGGGGIQVGGGSTRALVAHNHITGGVAHGITLGSVTFRRDRPEFGRIFDDFVARAEADPARVARASAFEAGAAHFAALDRQPGGLDVREDAAGAFAILPPIGGTFVSDGDLRDIDLRENTVSRMGGCGIAVARFFDLVEGDGDFISVHGLSIRGNHIDDCLRVRFDPVPERLVADMAVGGIALANVDGGAVVGNTIERCGAQARVPACGIFVLHATGLDITGNRIRHNGRTPQQDAEPRPERRGGIVVGYAEVPTREVRPRPNDERTRRRQDGTPALRVHDNVVIAPEGRALDAIALGPVSIHGNQFTTLGADFRNRPDRSPAGTDVPEGAPLRTFIDALGGAVVSVVDLGVSNELYLQVLGFSAMGLADALAQPDTDGDEDRPVLAGGNVLFNDNQVVLDALDGISTFALSAITLVTLDDLAMGDNQSDCDLVLDLVAVNTFAIGFSLRVADNRFKEGFFNAFYSAFTLGYMNSTTDNQGTHCFVRVGRQVPAVHQNLVLRQILPGGEGACNQAAELERRLSATVFG